MKPIIKNKLNSFKGHLLNPSIRNLTFNMAKRRALILYPVERNYKYIVRWSAETEMFCFALRKKAQTRH